jgi:hypothetical protein
MKNIILIMLLSIFTSPSPAATPIQENQDREQVTLRGKVTEAKTGEPFAKVKVIVIGSDRSTVTDHNGEFILPDLPPGEIELYITTIGYGLVKKRITLQTSEKNELQIALHQEATPRLDTVTIPAGPFHETETNAASEHSLNKTELQSLSTVLVADPVRAAQALPGVAGNDDFKSEFALRGAGFRRVGFFVDGLSLPENPTHTIYGDDDAGQISILNADTITSVSLFSGVYPSKYGDGTAGMILLETRDGNRIKPSGRIAASLLSSSATFDGPMPGKRGAWLASARKSYLQYLLDVLNEPQDESEGFSIDFTDAQAKAVYDLTPQHQIGINAIIGRSDFDPNDLPRDFGPNEIARSDSRISLIYAHWNYSGGHRFSAQTRFFGLFADFDNANVTGLPLQHGQVRQAGVRSDISATAHAEHRIEAGIYLSFLRGSGMERRYSQPAPITLSNYDRRGNQQGYYLQDTWSSKRFAFALTGGARIDHFELSGETVVTPRAALSFAPWENTTIRLGWGQYSEFPDFGQLFGSRGHANLRAERATNYNLRAEHLINPNTRIVIEAYDREERNLLFSLNESLIQNGRPTFISFPFRNSLRGYARGFEVSLHRRSANRLAGWITYAYSTTRQHEQITGLSFVSDHDQRHTVGAYGSYRFTNTFNLSGQWRHGSGLPMIGFFREGDGRLVVGSERNSVRLPAFSRLDLRASKAFHFKRSKLTLSGEVINVFARDNYRQAGQRREKLLPFLPSIGVAFEF